MYSLYIGDVDEQEVLGWIIENIGPLVSTTRHEYAYNDRYHGEGWTMDTNDVSDVSLQYDTITLVVFNKQEDVMLTKLRWGGSIS